MPVTAHVLFGHEVGITDVIVITGVVAYIASQVRDFRPIRTLRRENADLRAMHDALEGKYNELSRRYDDLAHRYGLLEKSRDFQASLAPLAASIEHAFEISTQERGRILAMVEQHETREQEAWKEITSGLASLTSVLTAVATTLDDERRSPDG